MQRLKDDGYHVVDTRSCFCLEDNLEGVVVKC